MIQMALSVRHTSAYVENLAGVCMLRNMTLPGSLPLVQFTASTSTRQVLASPCKQQGHAACLHAMHQACQVACTHVVHIDAYPVIPRQSHPFLT